MASPPRSRRRAPLVPLRPVARTASPPWHQIRTVFVVALVLAVSVVHAVTFYVSPTGTDNGSCGSQGSPCRTIAYTVGLAASGDSVYLEPGVYSGAGNTALTFPGKVLYFNSTGGSGATFLDGSASSRLFNFAGGEDGWVDGVTLRNGKAISGGCVLYTGASLSFYNSVFESCQAIAAANETAAGTFAEGGGAVYILNSSPRFINVTFNNNYGNQAAGSVWLENGAAPVFRQCKFNNDRAASFGGSVVPEGTSDGRFYDCVWNNCWSKFGGTIDTGSTSTTEFWNVVVKNSVGQRGGAVYHYNADQVKFYNSLFINNSAETNGGAIVFSISVTSLYSNCTFINNTAGGVGGALYAESSVMPTIIDSSFYNNYAPGGGGAIYGRGSAKYNLTGTTVAGHTSIYGAGLLFEDSTVVTADRLVCTNNTAQLDGGCAKTQNSALLTITNSVLQNNVAATDGGAIQTDQNSQLTLVNTQLLRNVASGLGGGLYSAGSSAAIVNGTTFQGNTGKNGGALALYAKAMVALHGSTLLQNTATLGGGIYAASANGFTADSNTQFVGNTGMFGGAVFYESTSSGNVITGGSITDNSARAGAAFFYNVWQQLVAFSGVTFTNNTALYGPIEATKPWRMVNVLPLQTNYSPKDMFSLQLRLVDYFNNTALDTVEQVIAQIAGLNGLAVGSTIFRQGFQQGYVLFDNLAVTGTLTQSYTLQVTASGLPSLNYPITIVSCGPGYTKTSTDSDPSYMCKVCDAGTYSLIPDAACLTCPTGGDCPGGANITASEGWWLDPESVTSKDPKLYRCRPGNCVGKSQCDVNRSGRLCSKCADGFSEWSNKCQDCSSTTPGWLLIPLTAGFVYSAFLIRFPRLTEAGIPKSLVFFIQAALILMSADQRISAQAFLSTINLGFDWMVSTDYRSRCVLNLNPLQRLAYEYYAPSTPIMGVFACYMIMRLYYLLIARTPVPSYWNWRTVSALIWVLLWGYLMVAKASLNLVNCIQIGSSNVLAAAPDVVCGSSAHIPFMAFAWIVIVFYVVGLPALCIGLLWYARKRLAVDPQYPLVKELYRAFTPALWYYEIVLTFRKLLLTLFDVLLSTKEDVHSMVLCVFFYVIYVVQYSTQPFKNRLFNRAEDFLLMILLLMSGFSLGDTMRTNFESKLDITMASLTFVLLGVLLVLFFIILLTDTGARYIGRLVSRHPILARSVNNMAVISQRLAQMGSMYSVGKTSAGSNGNVHVRDQEQGGGVATTSPPLTSGHLEASADKKAAAGSATAQAPDIRRSGVLAEEKPAIVVTPGTTARSEGSGSGKRSGKGA
ncbi:hypothetical protein GGF31_003908 [Allomyces arbusculus]|nr:hypothetical protein GGF31_003908 [Allomyces arbusculus]